MKRVIAILLLLALCFGCTACGKTDWSKKSFADFDPVEFMAKTNIKYELGAYAKTASADQYAAWAPTFLILYDDGSAFATGSFDQKGLFPPNVGVEIYDKNEIYVVWFGSWTEKNGKVSLHLTGARTPEAYENGVLKKGKALEEVLMHDEYEAELENGVFTIIDFVTNVMEPVNHPLQSYQPLKYASMQAYNDSIRVANRNNPAE